MKEKSNSTGEIKAVTGSPGQEQGEVTLSEQSLKQGEITLGSNRATGEITISHNSDNKVKEEVVLIFYKDRFSRELSEEELELIRQDRGFINREKGIVILAHKEHPALQMNQRQADSLDIDELKQALPFSPNTYLYVVSYLN